MAWVITSKTRFYLHEGETLLDGLLRTGHDVNFQCKAGYCGSCRVKLISSSHSVTYAQPPLAMLEKDDILPCCCRVTGVIAIQDQNATQHSQQPVRATHQQQHRKYINMVNLE